MAKTSIAYKKFSDKVRGLEQHMEVVDISIKIALANSRKNKSKECTIIAGLNRKDDVGKYPKLNNQPVKEAPRIFNFSKTLHFEHTIIAMYRYFTEYLRDVLSLMRNVNPLPILSKVEKEYSFREIHNIVNKGGVSAEIAIKNLNEKMLDEIFRSFENERSTISLLNKVLKHTKVDEEISFPRGEVLPFLEMRHLFIHNSGRYDEQFVRKYPDFIKRYSQKIIKENDVATVIDKKLPTIYEVACDALQALTEYLSQVDKYLVDKKFIEKIA